jgi:Flp pilus assembly protein TadG
MTRHNGTRKRPADAGAALVEMTLIAPFLIMLLIGIVEVARYATFAIMVGNAARAGVQYGAQNMVLAMDSAGMANAAKNDAQNIAGLSNPTATYFCKCSDGTSSTCQPTDCSTSHRLVYVQVTVSGTFTSMLHFWGVQNTFPVTSQATMRVAQ